MSRREILRDRGVRALVTGEAISIAGSQMTYIVLPWFVLTTTGSAVRTSIVVAAEMAPVAFLGLASGSIVSKLGARRTMLLSDVSRSLLLGTIPVLHLLDVLSFPLLVGLVFCIGVFMVPHATAQRVIVPELVGEDEGRVGEVQSLIQVAWAVAGIAGPAIGGLLIGLVGETNVLFIDAASYALSATLLGLFVHPRHLSEVPEDEKTGVVAGVRFLFGDALLRVWMLSITGINVVWSAFGVMFPVLVLERYGEHPEILGWIFGAFGVGAIVGSIASFGVIARLDRIVLASTAQAGQMAVLWLLFPDMPWPAVAAAALVTGVFAPVINSTVITTRTMRTPPFLRASVHAAAVTVALILAPLGALAAGPLLHLFGLDAAIAAFLTLNTFCGIAFVAAGVRERRASSGDAYRTRTEEAFPAESATRTSMPASEPARPSRTR